MTAARERPVIVGFAFSAAGVATCIYCYAVIHRAVPDSRDDLAAMIDAGTYGHELLDHQRVCAVRPR